jgi:hypothetical protein
MHVSPVALLTILMRREAQIVVVYWRLPVLQMIPFDDLVDVGVLAEPELPIKSVAYHSDT